MLSPSTGMTPANRNITLWIMCHFKQFYPIKKRSMNTAFLFSSFLFTTKTSPGCQICGGGGVLGAPVTISSLMGGREGQTVDSGTSDDIACETLPKHHHVPLAIVSSSFMLSRRSSEVYYPGSTKHWRRVRFATRAEGTNGRRPLSSLSWC